MSCLSLKSWMPCTIASWCDALSARSPAPSWAAWLAWQPARGPPTLGLALLGSPAAMGRQQWRRLRVLLGWTLKTSGGPQCTAVSPAAVAAGAMGFRAQPGGRWVSPMLVVLPSWLTLWLKTLLVPSRPVCGAPCQKGCAHSGNIASGCWDPEVVAAAGRWGPLGAVHGTCSGRRAEACCWNEVDSCT